MTLMPPAEYLDDPVRLLALCVWRESRSEPPEAKLGVAWTVRNRCAMAPREGFRYSIVDNILKPWAFSSFNANDPNARLYPGPMDRSWKESLAAAESNEPDPTDGSIFYFSPPLTAPPSVWGPVEHAATIGRLRFYRPCDPLPRAA